MNVLEYADLFAETFQKDIIDNENISTNVCDVINEHKVTEKGHCVGLAIRLGKENKVVMQFYMENIMYEDPDGANIKTVVTAINEKVNELYKKMQNDGMLENIPDKAKTLEPDEYVIVSGRPLAVKDVMPLIAEGQEYESFEDKTCGIEIVMKTCLKSSNGPTNMYAVVRKLTDADNKEMVWLKARQNSLNNSNINVAKISELSHVISDKNTFADYFYLIYTDLLSDMCDKLEKSAIYILPIDAFTCYTLMIPKSYSEKETEEAMANIVKPIIKDYMSSENMLCPIKFTEKTGRFEQVKI